MPILSDREQQQLRVLRHARETFRRIYELAGDAAFWNEGGQGYTTIAEIDGVLAESTQENNLDEMSTPQLLVLLQVSLGKAYLTFDALSTRDPAKERGLDTLVLESLRLGEPKGRALATANPPGFRPLLATLRGVVDTLMDLADASD